MGSLGSEVFFDGGVDDSAMPRRNDITQTAMTNQKSAAVIHVGLQFLASEECLRRFSGLFCGLIRDGELSAARASDINRHLHVLRAVVSAAIREALAG